MSYEDFPFEDVSEDLEISDDSFGDLEDEFDDSGCDDDSDFGDGVSVDLDDEDFEDAEV
ncbi:hypothetical protein O0S10_10315 [Methanocorpusculum sp. MG]|uniref:Uncharacterized protein n=1 Tax=Methanocorpusculum petauri TaxID=3002863 RepID=A0ABT4IJ64_9EURY|nr:hypothetical protein [Methanocorpusculum petauri]MCZ0861601.1 hypothetical protein [Methanocorpusculum petauri]